MGHPIDLPLNGPGRVEAQSLLRTESRKQAVITSTLMVRVRKKTREALDIASFELVSADATPLPRFMPGSHIDVHLGPELVRQYSLCNGPQDPGCYWIAVKREAESRGGSRAMHEQVKQGDTLTISTPRNNFAIEPSGIGKAKSRSR